MLSQMLWQPTCSARRSGSQHAQPDALAANMFSQTLWQPLSMARRSGSQQAQPDALAATDAWPDALAAGHATGGTQMLYRHAHGQLSAFCRQLPVCEVQPLALPTKHEVEPHACKLGLGSSSGAEVNCVLYSVCMHLCLLWLVEFADQCGFWASKGCWGGPQCDCQNFSHATIWHNGTAMTQIVS